MGQKRGEGRLRQPAVFPDIFRSVPEVIQDAFLKGSSITEAHDSGNLRIRKLCAGDPGKACPCFQAADIRHKGTAGGFLKTGGQILGRKAHGGGSILQSQGGINMLAYIVCYFQKTGGERRAMILCLIRLKGRGGSPIRLPLAGRGQGMKNLDTGIQMAQDLILLLFLFGQIETAQGKQMCGHLP